MIGFGQLLSDWMCNETYKAQKSASHLAGSDLADVYTSVSNCTRPCTRTQSDSSRCCENWSNSITALTSATPHVTGEQQVR